VFSTCSAWIRWKREESSRRRRSGRGIGREHVVVVVVVVSISSLVPLVLGRNVARVRSEKNKRVCVIVMGER